MISKIIINNKEYSFGHRTFITSAKNSKGKTTLMRSILFALGLISSPNFVDGTHIKNLNVELFIKINNNEFKFLRTAKQLFIYNDNALIRTFNTKNNEYIRELMSWFDVAFSFEGNVIRTLLYSNYIDQQYGNHVINKGRTGFFPKELRFEYKDFIKNLDRDLMIKESLDKKSKELADFENNIEYISKHSVVKSKQLSFNFFKDNNEAMQLSALLLRKDKLESRKKYFDNKKKVMNDTVSKLLDLNLVYKDADGVNHKITIENVSESYNIEKTMINEEILIINEKIKAIEEMEEKSKQLLIDSGFKPQMIEAELIRRQIERSKSVETDLTVIEDLKKTKDEISNELKEIEKTMKLNFYNEISEGFKRYLIKFNDKDNTFKDFIESIDKKKYTFLESTWSSYVGAIRFAIGASMKFAIADLLLEKGIEFPIFIDKLIHEELDDEKLKTYQDILLSRKEQLIIANIENPFNPKDMEVFKDFTINVNKDIVENGDISLFSTND